MKITRFSFPVLLETLSSESQPAEVADLSEMDADVSIGTVTIDTEQEDVVVQATEMLAETPGNERDPELMTGGRVAYVSDDHGFPTLYVREHDGFAVPLNPQMKVRSHIVGRDGSSLLIMDQKGDICQWTEKDGLSKPLFKAGRGSRLLGFAEDGVRFLLSKRDRSKFSVLIHDLYSAKTDLVYSDHRRRGGPEFSATISPEGTHLFVGRNSFITRINLKDFKVDNCTLSHNPAEFDMAPRILTSLSERFLVLGSEIYLEGTSEHDPDCWGCDCEATRYPPVRPALSLLVYDMKEQKELGGVSEPLLGGLTVAGGTRPERSHFERDFPDETEFQKETQAEISRREGQGRKAVPRLNEGYNATVILNGEI